MDFNEKTTLKEKLKTHINERKIWLEPKDANKVGVAWFLFSISSAFYTGVFILTPYSYSAETSFTASLIGTYICFFITYNWFMCARKYTNAVPKSFKRELINGEQQRGWRHCARCENEAPPRSHHCKLCQACMLKHDHHCYFMAGCIGFNTQRYFYCWALWLVIGYSYYLMLLAHYTYSYAPFPEAWSRYVIFVTVKECFEGTLSLGQLYMILQFYLALANMGTAAFYLFMQTMAIMYNQTPFEAFRGIRRYNQGLAKNLRFVFGKYWFIKLFLPIPTNPEGDGFTWHTTKSS